MTIDAIIKNFYDEIDSSSNSYSSRRSPVNKRNAYKLFEESNNIVFRCLAPGMNKEDIDITFDRKKLFLKTSEDAGDSDFSTKFNDAISLYKSIDAEKSFAQLNKGILTVTMPIEVRETKKKILFR